MKAKKKKRGSATFVVVMLMTVVLILVFSLIPLTLSNSKQSNMLYSRNRTYYTGEGTMDKMLHYIDVFSEKARISAYDKCFTKEGGINLSNKYVNHIYEMYSPSDKDVDPSIDFDTFKEMLTNYYKHEFNIRINAFFNEDETSVINLLGNSEEDKDQKVLYSWESLKGEVEISEENSTKKIETLSKVEAKSEFSRFKPSADKEKEFSNMDYEKDKLNPLDGLTIPDYIYEDTSLRDTFYVETNDKGTLRYSSITIDFDPIERDKTVTGDPKVEKVNDALKYGIICEDNLIAENNLTVDSSVIVGGQGEPKADNSIETIEYGGLLAGSDESVFEKIGIKDLSSPSKKSGSIHIIKDAMVGETDSSGNIHGGFIETIGDRSSIKIDGNSYSHSIVTNENSSEGKINIGKSAFTADNVSLNGDKNNIDIKNHLIGFEDGSNIDNNHLSSPAIVVNKLDGESEGKLNIGGQVSLSGEGFVENLVRKHNEKDVLFKTFETTAIYPNYVSYSTYLNEKFGVGDVPINFDDFYEDYSVKGSPEDESLPISMLDKYAVMNPSEEKKEVLENLKKALGIDSSQLVGISFVLSYFIDYKDHLGTLYDMGKDSLLAGNINIKEGLDDKFVKEIDTLNSRSSDIKSGEDILKAFSDVVNGEDDYEGLNISFFNYIMYANGNMYLTRTPEKNLLEDAEDAINDSSLKDGKIIIKDDKYTTDGIGAKLRDSVYTPIKNALVKRLNLQDVITDETLKINRPDVFDESNPMNRLDRCFNWDKLNGDISISNNDVFIKVSRNNIPLSSEDIKNMKGKTVFIASEGNVILDANEDIEIEGSIMSKKNIVTKNEDIKITANDKTALKISNYKDDAFQEFLGKGFYEKGRSETINGVSRTVKSNIKIVNRRQVLE